jgi:hypothetical protein
MASEDEALWLVYLILRSHLQSAALGRPQSDTAGTDKKGL